MKNINYRVQGQWLSINTRSITNNHLLSVNMWKRTKKDQSLGYEIIDCYGINNDDHVSDHQCVENRRLWCVQGHSLIRRWTRTLRRTDDDDGGIFPVSWTWTASSDSDSWTHQSSYLQTDPELTGGVIYRLTLNSPELFLDSLTVKVRHTAAVWPLTPQHHVFMCIYFYIQWCHQLLFVSRKSIDQ